MSDEVQEHGFHGGAASSGETTDEVVYLSSDKMGESSLQVFVSVLLMELLRDYFAAEGRPAFVSTNQFFYFKRGDPRAAVSPDLYVIDGENRHPGSVPSWKVWEHDGKVPAFVLEVVSDEYRKDYADRLTERYQQLGVRELLRYDPGYRSSASRSLLTHWVANAEGILVQRPTPKDRVQSAVFGFWLVLQPDRALRLALGPHGEALWPTRAEKAEAAEAARAAAEAEKAAAEAEKAAAEAEKAAAEAGKAAAEAGKAAAEAEKAAAEAGRAAEAEARRAAEGAREAEAAARREAEAARDAALAESERLRAEIAALRSSGRQ